MWPDLPQLKQMTSALSVREELLPLRPDVGYRSRPLQAVVFGETAARRDASSVGAGPPGTERVRRGLLPFEVNTMAMSALMALRNSSATNDSHVLLRSAV
jgi:hypothetical protein